MVGEVYEAVGGCMNEPWQIHSASYGRLLALRLIEFVTAADDITRHRPTFFGRDIHVDDRFDRNPLLEAVAYALVEQGR